MRPIEIPLAQQLAHARRLDRSGSHRQLHQRQQQPIEVRIEIGQQRGIGQDPRRPDGALVLHGALQPRHLIVRNALGNDVRLVGEKGTGSIARLDDGPVQRQRIDRPEFQAIDAVHQLAGVEGAQPRDQIASVVGLNAEHIGLLAGQLLGMLAGIVVRTERVAAHRDGPMEEACDCDVMVNPYKCEHSIQYMRFRKTMIFPTSALMSPHSPVDSVLIMCMCTDEPPALTPIMVTRNGSPPKRRTFRCTQRNAIVWSLRP